MPVLRRNRGQSQQSRLELGLRSQPWTQRGERSSLRTRIRGDGKRFVVRADEKLTAFVELESAISDSIKC
jgi:hypothetical protein